MVKWTSVQALEAEKTSKTKWELNCGTPCITNQGRHKNLPKMRFISSSGKGKIVLNPWVWWWAVLWKVWNICSDLWHKTRSEHWTLTEQRRSGYRVIPSCCGDGHVSIMIESSVTSAGSCHGTPRHKYVTFPLLCSSPDNPVPSILGGNSEKHVTIWRINAAQSTNQCSMYLECTRWLMSQNIPYW